MNLSESMRLEAIRLEYEVARLSDWSTERVRRCANNLGCTVRELCAVCGMSETGRINALIQANRWPVYLTVQMNKIERFKLGARSPDIQDCIAVKIFDLTPASHG